MVRITRSRSLVLDTLAQLANIVTHHVKRWFKKVTSPQPAPFILVVATDIGYTDGIVESAIPSITNTTSSKEDVFVKRGSKYFPAPIGSVGLFRRVIKGKQHRYVPLAA